MAEHSHAGTGQVAPPGINHGFQSNPQVSIAPITAAPNGSTTAAPQSQTAPIAIPTVPPQKQETAQQAIPKKPNSRDRFGRLITDTWMVEYASLVSGTLCLIGIFILLGLFDGKPLDKWHSYLSINTITSGLATAVSACTMLATAAALGQLKWLWFERKARPLDDFGLYDEASRGLPGAIQLLCHLRFWHFASLGCLISILSALSPSFVQASVITTTRPITLDRAASVPIAALESGINDNLFAVTDLSLLHIKFALLSGTASDGSGEYASLVSSVGVKPYCPTGDCQFGQISTLGMCSECKLSAVDVNTHEGADGWVITANVSTNPAVSLVVQNITMQDLTEWVDIGIIDVGVAATDLNSSSQAFPGTARSLPLVDVDILLAKTYAIYDDFSPCYVTDQPFTVDQAATWYQAVQCSLSLCAQVYSSEVNQGTLKEERLQIIPNGAPSSQYENYFIFDADPSATPSSIMVDYSSYYELAAYLSGTTAAVDVTSIVRQNDDLSGTGSVRINRNCSDEQQPTNDFSSDVVKGIWSIWEGKGIHNPAPHAFDRVADAVTNGMRVGTNATGWGSATTIEAYIHVRWAYMTVPSLMVLLACIFVPLTCYLSARRGVPIWKADALASIVHAHKWVDRGMLATNPAKLDHVGELHDWASGTHVRLRSSVP